MAYLTEAEGVRDLAIKASRWHRVEAGEQYAWPNENGEIDRLDLSGDMPARKYGTVTVRDTDSFAAYWDKHHDADSEVYADLEAARVTAVLDAHQPAADGEGNGARW